MKLLNTYIQELTNIDVNENEKFDLWILKGYQSIYVNNIQKEDMDFLLKDLEKSDYKNNGNLNSKNINNNGKTIINVFIKNNKIFDKILEKKKDLDLVNKVI